MALLIRFPNTSLVMFKSESMHGMRRNAIVKRYLMWTLISGSKSFSDGFRTFSPMFRQVVMVGDTGLEPVASTV
jgi:hypothetical protein